jgi:predicted ArsR family transcriptional regulator
MAGERAGLTAVSSLEDPVRARLYRIVAESDTPIGRDEAAAAAGIGRSLAAYHLDRLAELDLLTASYQRPEGRSGPGAGRPAKVYSRSDREFAVSVPPREYELAARLLAVAVEADAGGPSWTALHDAAWQFGCNLGRRGRAAPPVTPAPTTPAPTTPAPTTPAATTPAPTTPTDGRAAVEAALRDHGFEPWHDASGTIQLRNCPFHSLAALHPDMVCGMNLSLMRGLVEGLEADELSPELNPGQGRCCVVLMDRQQQTGER